MDKITSLKEVIFQLHKQKQNNGLKTHHPIPINRINRLKIQTQSLPTKLPLKVRAEFPRQYEKEFLLTQKDYIFDQ